MIAHIKLGNPDVEQTITDHLEETAQVAKRLGAPLGIGCLAYLAGLYHDIGKFRKEFQRYIRTAVYEGSRKNQKTVNHSSAGAIYIYQRFYNGSQTEKLTAQLICEAILSHHGINDCMSAKGEDCFRKRVENLDNLDYDEIMENLYNSNISEHNTDSVYQQAVGEVAFLQKEIISNKLSSGFTNGMIERMLSSILIDADRLGTAVFCGDRSPSDMDLHEVDWKIPQIRLERTLADFPQKEGVFAVRRKIADECLEFSTKLSGIYRLSVPTGGAKTLSSMRYAINHAKVHKKKRIFYIGPYLSILEQNSQVFRNALGEDLVLEHHSNVIMQEDKENDENQYRHLTENWDNAIVITTFVQFLNTLFDAKTGAVRRFHNLADSVIIIDEIQSLPINMLHLFNMTMNYLSHLCHTTILLCSATQPVLERVPLPIHMSEPPDIISDVDGVYGQLKRVRVEEVQGVLSTEKLCAFLRERLNQEKDILVILNTKKAVETVYRELKMILDEWQEPINLIHLSTSMCPEHRLMCINQMKDRKSNDRLVCVSTPLIEAGVDLSFACVVRSYAGLDSIAQAAGRCNRNGEQEEGIVYLIRYEVERLGYLEQIRKGAECSDIVVDHFRRNQEKYRDDLLSRPALEAYYQNYYYDLDQRQLMDYPLKEENTTMVDLLSRNIEGKKAYAAKHGRDKNPDLVLYQAFKTAGEKFTVIDQNTIGVLVPFGEGENIISKLNGDLDRREVIGWIRKGQRYTVNFYRHKIYELTRMGALTQLKNGNILSLKSGFYDINLGVVLDGKEDFLMA
jgi:CRISPR-associated endonuclease/helicase Cas3